MRKLSKSGNVEYIFLQGNTNRIGGNVLTCGNCLRILKVKIANLAQGRSFKLLVDENKINKVSFVLSLLH